MKEKRNEKRIAYLTLAFVLGLTTLAGCGGNKVNTQKQQAAAYYQDELGLDKDEAGELAQVEKKSGRRINYFDDFILCVKEKEDF